MPEGSRVGYDDGEGLANRYTISLCGVGSPEPESVTAASRQARCK